MRGIIALVFVAVVEGWVAPADGDGEEGPREGTVWFSRLLECENRLRKGALGCCA